MTLMMITMASSIRVEGLIDADGDGVADDNSRDSDGDGYPMVGT